MSKMGSYMNLKGTTFPSFKMGKKGIELYSAAKIGNKELPGLFFKSKVEDIKSEEEEEIIESLEQKIPDYDVAISSKNIKRVYATKAIGSKDIDTLTIVLTNGDCFSISQNIKAEALYIPQDEDIEDGEIAVYTRNQDTNLVVLGRSNKVVTDTIKEDYSEENAELESKEIPTVNAVRTHINGLTTILETRRNGIIEKND